MTGQYILIDKTPVPIKDTAAWGAWFEKADRKIGRTNVTDEVWVSTVFLGLDHGFGGDRPILFETMVFRGDDMTGEDMERYATYDEALAGHTAMVRRIAEAEGVNPDDIPTTFSPPITRHEEEELELRWPLLEDIYRRSRSGTN